MSATVLPDVLVPGLRVVFCGTAAGTVSARTGAYYAGPGNQFWLSLQHVGLTPRVLAPKEFIRLPEWGIGLTDVCKVSHGMDQQIASSDYDVAALARAMRRFAPAALAFTSKRAAAVAFRLRGTAALRYGRQDTDFEETPTWVLPSPSGAARRYWSVDPWRDLAGSLPSFTAPTAPIASTGA